MIEVKPTALSRTHALDCAVAAGLGRATPHASPRERAADDDDVTIKRTITADSQYSTLITSTYDLDFSSK